MYRFSKFMKVLALSLCLFAIGAASPGIAEHDAMLEVMRVGDCPATKNGWKACTCMPIDLGDVKSVADILKNVGEAALNILKFSWLTGNWDLGNRTKDPSDEDTQIKVWLQYLQEELASETALMQAKAMTKPGSISHSNVFNTSFTNSMNYLRRGNAYSGVSNTESQFNSDFPSYTGIHTLSTEEDRLFKRWRDIEKAHMLAMNAIAKRYDAEKSIRDALYNALLQDPGTNSVNFMSTATSEIISGLIWATMDGSPQYPFTSLMPKALELWAKLMVEKEVNKAMNDAMGETMGKFMPLKGSVLEDVPNSGMTQLLQLVTSMTDDTGTLIERNGQAFGNFLDVRSVSEQRERARTQAIQANMIEISKNAAQTRGTGKSYNLGF